MSVVEDVRPLIQDFLAPELRAMTARLDSFEKIMDARFATVDAKLLGLEQKLELRLDATDAKIDRLEKRLDTFERSVETRLTNQDKLGEARHNEIMANFETMKINLQLNSRLERLEAQQPAASQ